MEAYLEDSRPTLDEICEEYKECCRECPAYGFCNMETPKDIVGFVEYILDAKLDDWHKKYLEKMYELYKAGKFSNEDIIKTTRGRAKADRDAMYLLYIYWYETFYWHESLEEVQNETDY